MAPTIATSNHRSNCHICALCDGLRQRQPTTAKVFRLIPSAAQRFGYHGLKKRGYCYQWSEDLLIALDALRLSSLELRWGEANPGNWRENNCIVVTAKGRPFRSGIMLDCWRHLGHLYFRPVVADTDPYVENRAYARFVLARSATRNVSGPNHRVAFQRSNEASGNTGDN